MFIMCNHWYRPQRIPIAIGTGPFFPQQAAGNLTGDHDSRSLSRFFRDDRDQFDAMRVICGPVNTQNNNYLKGGLMLCRILIVLTMVILFNITGKSQDAEFSQFYANPLYLNPALSGAEYNHRAVLNYRNQWPGIDKGFVTYNASYDQYIDKIHGGVGVLIDVDNAGAGILTTTQASLIYAYTLKASPNLFINMALQATFFQRSLNWSLLRFGDQIDLLRNVTLPTDETPPENTSVIVPDFSAGVVFGWKSALFGGIAVNHLTEPNLAFYSQYDNNLPVKITGHLGANINLEGGSMLFEPTFYISPNILYQQQGNFHQINAGVYVARLPMVLGIWYRHNLENADAIIVLAGINYNDFKIGYSYDITLSEIKSFTGGAHEISVAWQFSTKRLRRIYPLVAPGF
jgi:type IX secretion system PorP/SprF family membrane protein